MWVEWTCEVGSKGTGSGPCPDHRPHLWDTDDNYKSDLTHFVTWFFSLVVFCKNFTTPSSSL